jgi:predicted dithiol-disulfide oxidoreductase (DUF899 family)
MYMDFTRLKESDDYRRQREELRVAELDLIDHAEHVAALRRKLPADTAVDDTSWSTSRPATAYGFPNCSALRTAP